MDPKVTVAPVAVIGMAGRFPGAEDVDRFWRNLLDGVESIERLPAEELSTSPTGSQFVGSVGRVDGIEDFDADYFRVPPAEAVLIDPQHRVLLEVAATALQDAGYDAVRDQRIGVYVGCGENYYLREFVEPREAALADAPKSAQPSAGGTDARILSGNEKDFLAARIAFKLGLLGPSVTVQATCASSLTAVALACSALAVGDCDIALAGGVALVMPDMHGYAWSAGGIFSDDGRCRAFDADASGTVPGAGAAMVVLRRDADARAARDHRRVLIRGWATNNDGGSRAGFTAPSAAGQEAVIRAALARAQVTPDEVGYVETHGTATPIGDAVEVTALGRVFGAESRPPSSLVLGAVKPSIGHADAAAGVIGLIKATLGVENAIVPATLHFRAANPELRLDRSPFRVSSEATPWEVPRRIAGVSAFGLGGNNAHIVIEAVPPQQSEATRRDCQVVALSARSEAQLLRQRSQLADWVERRAADAGRALTGAELADVAFTLAVGRPVFEYRWSACVADAESLTRSLRATDLSQHPVLRWSVAIVGSVVEHTAAGLERSGALIRTAADRLAARAGVEILRDVERAALGAIAAVHALTQLGFAFNRVEGPSWLRPVLDWHTAGAEPATLAQALAACVPDDDTGAARAGGGVVEIGPGFDLASAVARGFALGVRPAWTEYYRFEERGRIPLPTYSFERQRHWLPRAVAAASTPDGAAAPGPDVSDVSSAVATVWQAVLGVDAIDPDAHFLDDLGGDSMYAVEIGARLTELFHVDLALDLPFVAPTVRETAALITVVLAGDDAGGKGVT